MKATKKPKRPNPFRSDVGYVNRYPDNTPYSVRRGEMPPPPPVSRGSIRLNRNGVQHSTPLPIILPPRF